MTGSNLRLNELENAQVNQSPFPYCVIDNILHDDKVSDLLDCFPIIEDGGSFALDQLKFDNRFSNFIAELDSEPFRQIISEKFNIDLSGRPMVVTARGISRAKDGRIHTDSKSKLVTILIYFNESWEAQTGRLRILNNGTDMNDFVAEVAPTAGKLIAFKVTENCWHGYPSFDGVRKSIQINFVTDDSAAKKHGSRHGFTAKLKALKKKILG